MRARAETTAATREKILDAAEATFDESPIDEFTLAAVAKRSGVTVQTILRHLGSRDGMILATLVHAGLKMRSNREAAPVGDVDAAIAILVDHYEKFGDRILRLLSEEDRFPAIRTMTDFGRTYHGQWCEQIFASTLKGLRGTQRKRRIAQFASVTDIYVWKLLRRDHGLSREQTKVAMRELLDPLTETGS